MAHLLQGFEQGQRLEVVERGDDDFDPRGLELTGQRVKLHRLVVKRLAHHHFLVFGLELGGGAIGQAFAVGRAIVQRGIAGCAELRGGKRANGARLQRVVGHHAEGGVQAQLGELGVGRNRNLGDVLGRIDGRGLNAHARIEVANDRHHPGVHQLLGHLLAGGCVGLVVHRHHFQLHALAIDHEAIAVQFFHRQVHAVEQVLPQRPQGAAQRLRHPDLDRVWHFAATRQQGASHECGKQGQGQRKTATRDGILHATGSK